MKAVGGSSFTGLLFLTVCILAITSGTTSIAQTTGEIDLLKSPEDGGPRRLEVVGGIAQGRAAPSLDAAKVGEFADGAVLANLGCSETSGRTWCQVRSIHAGVRGFVLATHLRPATGPDGVVPMGLDDSRQRARKRDFDATADVSCAQEKGQAMGVCVASVARGDGGDATVVVAFPNGFKRSLFFVHGEFVRASATMSGVGTDTDWRRESGLHHIRVDDQRYELPDALIIEK